MAECRRCEHAKVHGWWGPPYGLTHCHKCHRDWPAASSQAHCVLCCAHFSTPRIADLHLMATGCRPPGEVRAKGGKARLVLREDAHGPIWRGAGERPVALLSHEEARACAYAAQVSADPENAKWVAETKKVAERGVPPDEQLGYEELAELKRSARAGL